MKIQKHLWGSSRGLEDCQPELLRRYRLCEHQSVSVQIHDVELDHPVILRTKLTRNLQPRQCRVLFIQCLYIVGDDVKVPCVALPPPRIPINGSDDPEQIKTYNAHDFHLVRLEKLIEKYSFQDQSWQRRHPADVAQTS